MKKRKNSKHAAIQGAKSERSRRLGRERGYALGREHGYSLGRCHAVAAGIAEEPVPVRDQKVLFVNSGKGDPYSPLDEAVAEALAAVTRESLVVGPTDNLVAIADEFRPDLMLVMEGMRCPVDQVNAVRGLGIKTAVWFTDDPYYSDITAPLALYYDHVFTLEMNSVPFYESIGCPHVHYMPLAARTRVYRPQAVPATHRREVSFIGSGYWNRIAFFDEVAPALMNRQLMISGWWWDRLTHYQALAPKIQLGAWHTPEETSKYYYGAKIVVNMHRAHDDDSYNYNSRKITARSVNPRTFEIAASGAFQLTDVRSGLSELYEPGREIVTYDSPADFINKVNYYLEHEKERQDIALRGLARTLREHTYIHRVRQLLDLAMQREEAVR